MEYRANGFKKQQEECNNFIFKHLHIDIGQNCGKFDQKLCKSANPTPQNARFQRLIKIFLKIQ